MNFLELNIVEILQTETAKALITGDCQLLIIGPAPFLIFDELFESQAVHTFTIVAFSVVNFYTVDLG